ncbi:RNA polymerase sigma factor [Alkalihalobacillus sp. AL-G]|uniref:RNA polymerase sigma factor n=1 Tax=Alkalihalobacillus sp. AL-G TaxID=2926399 RepID=UPI00272A16F1|nr:sigma-70 family RNA polymerase sigma factor [Alkalihalobacillus sp. AL-G]WLD92429.1 sigma-70 family RNA polymerase sigma factor [Alkalihalobacillus sp. AL-G]
MDTERSKLLNQCLENYYDDILNFMYLRLNNHQDAEDMTQTVFLQIMKAIENYRGESSLRTWVFQIARNTLVNEYRQKSSLKRLFDRLKQHVRFQSNEPSPHKNIELFSLLDSLNERDCELIILKHYFGFTYGEISKITGLTSSNIGVRLARAIQLLNRDQNDGGDHIEQKSR